MTTLQSNTKLTDETIADQQAIIKAFFQTDSPSEMIESLHFMVESLLFRENLGNVSPEMRVHIVNQLRVASLISQLGDHSRFNGDRS